MGTNISKYALSQGTYLNNGRFIIKEAISRGGSSIVYKADQLMYRGNEQVKFCDVIIKEYCPEEYLSDDKEDYDGLMTRRALTNEFVFSSKEVENDFKYEVDSIHEHRIQLKVRKHDKLILATECFEENNTLYIVMPDLEADTLEERLRNSRLSPDESIDLIINLLGAVEQLHESGYCHGDLKPANILIYYKNDKYLPSDEVKLIDFGAVRKFDDDIFEYTRCYSPSLNDLEHMSGKEHDMFSIGVILYEVVCGNKGDGKNFTNRNYEQIKKEINVSIRKKGFISQNNEYVDRIAEAIHKLVSIPTEMNNLNDIRDVLNANKIIMKQDLAEKKKSSMRLYFKNILLILLILSVVGYIVNYITNEQINIIIGPATAEITDTPETSEVVEVAETTEVAEVAEIHEVTEEADTSEVAEEAETSEVAEEAETSEVAEEAETSEVAEEAETSEVTEEAETSEVAGEAEISEVVEEAETSEVAEEAETSKVVELNEASKVINENEELLMLNIIVEEATDGLDIVYEHDSEYVIIDFDDWKNLFVRVLGTTDIKKIEIENDGLTHVYNNESSDFVVQLSDILYVSKSDEEKLIWVRAEDINGNIDSVTIELQVDENDIVKEPLPQVTMYYLYGDQRIPVEDSSEISLSKIDKYLVEFTDDNGLTDGGLYIDGEEIMGIYASENLDMELEFKEFASDMNFKVGMEVVVIMNDNDNNTCYIKSIIVK